MAKIRVTEAETTALLKASGGRALPLKFGSHVWLDADRAPWAAELLLEWRGRTFTDGAGI